MAKRIVFVDVRNKLDNENELSSHLVESDLIVPLTPYSCYLMDKIEYPFKLFSELICNKDFRNEVLADYRHLENVFLKNNLESYLFLLKEFAKYITFDRYIRIVQSYINKSESVYISNFNSREEFGTNAPLSDFLSFCSEVKLSVDGQTYKRNKFKLLISEFKSKSFLELVEKIRKKLANESFYVYDNTLNVRDYKKIAISTKARIEHAEFLKLLPDIIGSIKLNTRVENILHKEILDFLSYRKSMPHYIPFMFLNGTSMCSRFLIYKDNKIPTIFFQHGSYVHENYFLKYNEVLPADINFVFNEYTKKAFEDIGAKEVHVVGTKNYNKPLRKRSYKFDFVYITYCTAYNYSGFYVGSEYNLVSPVAENIFKRHKEVIDLFGLRFPDKKICIKVQPGILTGQMLYIPLIEYSERYGNVTIVFDEPLHVLIEKSRNIISDYYSSEFSNKNILIEKNIILLTDIITLPNMQVVEELKNIMFLVHDFCEIDKTIEKVESSFRDEISNKSQEVINKYSSKDLNTKLIVRNIINKKLEKEYTC